jgi:hypothetical protein
MRLILMMAFVTCASLQTACSQPAPSKPDEAPAAAAPAIPPDVSAAAQALLGAEAEVLVHGDLAKTGKKQLLVINRLPKTPPGVAPGILFTRAVIAEEEEGKWKELLRADEYLKNPKGFLGLTPLDPVSAWRLQYEQDDAKGLQLYFTPLRQGAGSHIPPIGVRWNPATKRYQSLDRSYQDFVLEVPALEKIPSHLK